MKKSKYSNDRKKMAWKSICTLGIFICAGILLILIL